MLTAVSTLVVSGAAAAVGVVIAREFGRTDETDGLLASYGVFLVIAIAAQAIRIAVLPHLARARLNQRLAGEVTAFALALAVVSLPLVVVVELWARPLGGLVTGGESELARDTASAALQWMVPAGVTHLFAALVSSGLAALDDYRTPALGYAAGSVAGLGLILVRAEPDGIVAVAWGVTLNGAVALLVPLLGLALHAARTGMPTGALRPSGPPLGVRLRTFLVASSLPLALQALYVVCLPFAGREGTGAATSFVYAYLAASALVTVTASSLALTTSVPLTRSGLTPDLVTRHVTAAAWLSLAVLGAVSGSFMVAGADIVGAILGSAYGADVGAEIGRMVVLLAPWTVAAVGVALTFPLVFIRGATAWLPAIGGTAVLAQALLAFAASALAGLDGLALSLAGPTWLVLVALLVPLRALRRALPELVQSSLLVALLAALAFVPVGLAFDRYTAGAAGAVLYVALLLIVRPRGLRASWHHLRALG